MRKNKLSDGLKETSGCAYIIAVVLFIALLFIIYQDYLITKS